MCSSSLTWTGRASRCVRVWVGGGGLARLAIKTLCKALQDVELEIEVLPSNMDKARGSCVCSSVCTQLAATGSRPPFPRPPRPLTAGVAARLYREASDRSAHLHRGGGGGCAARASAPHAAPPAGAAARGGRSAGEHARPAWCSGELVHGSPPPAQHPSPPPPHTHTHHAQVAFVEQPLVDFDLTLGGSHHVPLEPSIKTWLKQ